jgi:phosphotransferase system IIA component
MRAADGTELLVHIGFNTVALQGEHFEALVGDGQAVRAGDTVVQVDLAAVAAAGYDTTTVVVVTGEGADALDPVAVSGTVVAGQDVVLRRVSDAVPQGAA